MQWIDWLVLSSVLLFIIVYGIWKTKSVNPETYIAGKQSPWWLVGLSVMATQASAITFLSTPGQAFQDGLGFVQFYFGLPIAMVILCIVVLPKYFALNVYTAYEYLENRFGLPTRILTAVLFLIQRGLACGITIFAPAIILSTILGWSLLYTNIIIGVLVIVYTLIGGTEAVNQTQKQQMLVIFCGMVFAFIYMVQAIPLSVSESLHLAGSLGKTKTIDLEFDLTNRYNIWSAFLGGTFLFLSYFGTDQSQVQRYISGENVKQAKLGLLFNGLLKVPMQFFILLTGVFVFVFFQFHQTPLHFNPNGAKAIQQNSNYQSIQTEYDYVFSQKQEAIAHWKEAKQLSAKQNEQVLQQEIQELHSRELALRQQVKSVIKTEYKQVEGNDTDYIFIHFIVHYLPHGLIGLLLAVILSAAMSSTASELNALATTSVVDIYKRNFNLQLSGKAYLNATRVFTFLWGCLAIFFAVKASLFENLIEAVNIIGSLFYGTILGVFALAFLFPKVKGRATLFSILIVEPFIIMLYWLNETGKIDLEYLWLNPIGCLLMIAIANMLQLFFGKEDQE